MDQNRFATLTSRQRETLTLLASPMRPKEVAVTMGVSARTVEAHLADATRRIGAGSSVEAVRLFAAYERGHSENLRTQKSRMEEPPATEATASSPVAADPVPQGRLVTLDAWQRSAIIVGLATALIFSVAVLINGGETAARIVRSAHLVPLP
jgi:DNA-binding CsgD family transcriptional regulator